MRDATSYQQPRGSGPDSESRNCAAGCVNHRWIVRQTQIVVGRKVDQLNSGELNDSTLGRFERLEMAAKPLPFKRPQLVFGPVGGRANAGSRLQTQFHQMPRASGWSGATPAWRRSFMSSW